MISSKIGNTTIAPALVDQKRVSQKTRGNFDSMLVIKNTKKSIVTTEPKSALSNITNLKIELPDGRLLDITDTEKIQKELIDFAMQSEKELIDFTMHSENEAKQHQAELVNHQAEFVNYQAQFVNYQAELVRHQAELVKQEAEMVKQEAEMVKLKAEMAKFEKEWASPARQKEHLMSQQVDAVARDAEGNIVAKIYKGGGWMCSNELASGLSKCNSNAEKIHFLEKKSNVVVSDYTKEKVTDFDLLKEEFAQIEKRLSIHPELRTLYDSDLKERQRRILAA